MEKAPTWPPVKWVDSLMALSWVGSMGCSCLRTDVAVGRSTCKRIAAQLCASSSHTSCRELEREAQTPAPLIWARMWRMS